MNNNATSGRMIAFLFDSGKIEDSWYRNVIFTAIFRGKEVAVNSKKIIVSVGDVTDQQIYHDIRPFLIHNELCTVPKEIGKYKDYLYSVLLEDIDTEVAKKIDNRLKSEFDAYVGMTEVDPTSTDSRKQFWKSLIRLFSVECESITAFGMEDEGKFNYAETAKSLEYYVSYDNFSYGLDGVAEELFSTRQSTIIHKVKQLEHTDGKSDADRGLWEMNFSLVKEVEIAGVEIWKAMEDINRVHLEKEDGMFVPNVTDYLFTSLYQAAQGMERLLKILIELYAYGVTDNAELQKINKLLYSHNHLAMVDFLNDKVKLSLDANCKRLLSILDSFYSKARYHRYSYSADNTQELTLIRSFGKDIPAASFDCKVKVLYGKAMGKTAHTLYSHIMELCTKLNIYAYELNCDSTAKFAINSYFGENLYELLKRIELSKKELLWYLICEGDKLLVAEYKEKIPALPFEECDLPELLKDFINGENAGDRIYEFVDDQYNEIACEDKNAWKERVNAIDLLIGNTDMMFDNFGEEKE